MGNTSDSKQAATKVAVGDVWSKQSSQQPSTIASASGDSLASAFKRPLPFRRYYPVSQQRNDDFFRSCPLIEADSPLRKRLRIGEDSFSLPAALTEPMDDVRCLSGAKAAPSLADSCHSNNDAAPPKSVTFDYCDGSNQHRRRPTFDSSTTSAKCSDLRKTRPQSYCDFSDSSAFGDDAALTSSLGGAAIGGRYETVDFSTKPITSAVISKGLKAKFKSLSAWLLHEHGQTPLSNSSSCPSGFSLKRWSSLRPSLSFGSPLKLKREFTSSLRRSLLSSSLSHRTNVSHRPTVQHDDRESVTSLNSLSDGRTPWPTPWLEAIFLPEFPNKGPVTEKSFAVLGTIAKGTFGKVYRVCLKNQSDSVFAMKVQGKSEVITQNAVQQIKDEVAIHQLLGEFGFIAQVHCTWQNRSKLYMVLQYVSGYGDLYQLWRDDGPFHEDAVKVWIAELAIALDHIHSNSVIYRDIKMENILLDDDGHIQLIDFGLSKWLAYGERTYTICGTLQYMAPEVLQGTEYGHAADWWSLGVLMHTLLLGSYPFGSASSHTTMQINDYLPPGHISESARSLLCKLLRKDPKWRMRSFTSFKQEPFFNKLSFEEVRLKKVHPFDYIPRMKRCNTCNIFEDDLQSLEDSTLTMFDEEYDVFKQFDYFSEDVSGARHKK